MQSTVLYNLAKWTIKKKAYFFQVNSSATLFLIHTQFFFKKNRTICGGLNDEMSLYFHYIPPVNHAVFLPIFITPAAVSMENLQGRGAMISNRQWLHG